MSRCAPPEEAPLSTQANASPSPAAGSCASCGALLASDQRYCLECGTRSHLFGGALANDLGALLAPKQPAAAEPVAAETPPDPHTAEPPRASSPTAVIAGVGVLLLSMGVGVLIGRSSTSDAKVATAPAQVISVSSPGASPGTGASSTVPSQTPAPTSTTHPTSTKSSSKNGAKKSSASSPSESSSSGVGQVPSKPAPPSVAEHAHGEKGQSYEQKSKSLPNVISTG
jgi:hypothetical protein